MLYLSFCYFSLLLIKYDEKTSMPLSIFLWDLVHRNLYQFDWRTITEPSSYFQISYILNNAVMSNTFEQHPWSFDRYKSWKAKFGVKKHSHCHILINCLPERCISFTVPSYPLIMLLAHFPTPSSVPPSMRSLELGCCVSILYWSGTWLSHVTSDTSFKLSSPQFPHEWKVGMKFSYHTLLFTLYPAFRYFP